MTTDSEKARIKCVVWDLDGTLWQGTLLEGDELALAPGAREAICELDNRGILQSIASRNNFDAAWSSLTAFNLDEYFLYPQIGWRDKSDSIRRIADGLGIGLGTFALFDDQPFERDEVKFFLPEVRVFDTADLCGLLDTPAFQPRFFTGETRLRRRMYQADLQRKQDEQEFSGNKAEFLATLDMRLTIRRACPEDLRRVEELTLRTNQFNSTGIILSLEELEKLLHSPGHLLIVAELDDRYGSSGTIGLSLIEQGRDDWVIKLLITSCRVISRGVGGTMLSHILSSAKRSGVRLRTEFVANDLNRMMYVTYKFHGFYEVGEKGGAILLEHDLMSIRPNPSHVVVRSDD